MKIIVRIVLLCAIFLGTAGGAMVAATPAMASQQFKIAFTGGIGVYPKTSPDMAAARAGAALPEGSIITVACELEGAPVSNGAATINVWMKLDNGSYIPNAFVHTGHDTFTPGVPRCEGTQPQQPAQKYDAAKAADWAVKNYRAPSRFAENGDCTWFVSQALWAGGLPKSSEWTDYSTDPALTDPNHRPGPTPAARVVHTLYKYLSNKGYAQVVPITWSDNTAAGAKLGDIIVYDLGINETWDLDHMAIVTGFTSKGYPLVTQKSYDVTGRFWSASSDGGWLEEMGAKAYLIKITY